MRTHITITSIDEFDNVTNTLKASVKRIKDNFNLETKNMNSLDGDPKIWKSKSQESLNAKYKQLNEIYPFVVESLENFVKFLEETSKNYKAFEQSTNRSVEQNLDNLDVQS